VRTSDTLPRALHELEEQFARLAPDVPDGPQKQALSVLHGILGVDGRRRCGISQLVRRHLDRLGVRYEYADLDVHPEAGTRLAWLTGGRVHRPVVSVGGELLVQPSISGLRRALGGSGAR